MEWFPIGPDFATCPRIGSYTRISKRNMIGMQNRLNCITFEAGAAPDVPENVYIVAAGPDGQCAAFRKGRGDVVWKAITDSLRSVDMNRDPRWVAVNPNNPLSIYVGTWNDQGIYVSSNRGDEGSWSPRYAIGGRVRKIIVNPSPPAQPDTTTLYAATDRGLFKSASNGTSWTNILPGNIWSFVLRADPASGTPHLYAGVYRSGIWYASGDSVDASSWTNLNDLNIGLPAYDPGDASTPANFDTIIVDCCASNPECAYAWFTRPGSPGTALFQGPTVGLYRTTSPLSSWQATPSLPAVIDAGTTTRLDPMQSYSSYAFAVAPNSPGDDSQTDVLFFGNIATYRSTDDGSTWTQAKAVYHVDVRCYAFYPEEYSPGTIPTLYVGCDGGLGANPALADRTVHVEIVPPDDPEALAGPTLPPSREYINENFGLNSSLVYALGGDPSCIGPPYIGCTDTGFSVQSSGLGWRACRVGDAALLTVVSGSDGIKVFYAIVGSAGSYMELMTDQGDAWVGPVNCHLANEPNGYIQPSSNFVVDSGNRCLVGAVVEETIAKTTEPAGPGSGVVVHVSSTTAISKYMFVVVGTGSDSERTYVDDVGSGTITLRRLSRSHAKDESILSIHDAVVRIGTDGIGARISGHFDNLSATDFAHHVVAVAADPAASPRTLACALGGGEVYTVDGAATDPGAPDWNLASSGQPSGSRIAGLAIALNGDVYILLLQPVTVASGGASVTTLLFRIAAGGTAWEPQSCTGVPAIPLPADGTVPSGRLVVDPVDPGRMFAGYGGRVFTLTSSGAVWNWTETAPGLPGCLASILWIGRMEDPAGGAAKILLRAGVVGRGVWEADVTPGATAPQVDLYIRRHILDYGRFRRSTDGLPNPFEPTQPVYHYQCDDIRIETPTSSAGGVYFQTDPDPSGQQFAGPNPGAPKISHVHFGLLRDQPDALPAGGTVRVHVQVHNRSRTALEQVRVWALYSHASAHPLDLNLTESGATFPFWDQFAPDGSINPVPHSGSEWKPIGKPVELDPIEVTTPRVASWAWQVPTPAAGDSGHYCIAVFVHCCASPIGETTRYDIDQIAPDNPQVGQKNVHVIVVPAGSGSGGSSSPSDTHPPSSPAQYNLEAVIEVNPVAGLEEGFDVVLEGAQLPTSMRGMVRVSSDFTTLRPLGESVDGVERIKLPGLIATILYLFRRLLRGIALWLGLLRPSRPLWRPDRIYLEPSAVFRIRGVVLASYRRAFVKISFTPPPGKPGDKGYRFDVQQRDGVRVIGGSAYLVKFPEP